MPRPERPMEPDSYAADLPVPDSGADVPRIASLRHAGRIAMWAGLLVLLMAALAGPASLAVPGVCSVCHGNPPVVTEWQASAHSGVGCGSCHTDRGAVWGLGNSLMLIADVSDQITGARVPRVPQIADGACRACHDPEGMGSFVRSGLRMSHAGLSDAGYLCTDCHDDTAHEVRKGRIPQPTMSLCATCHNGVKESGDCRTCHVEGGREPGEARRVDAEWAKTHGANWRRLHGMGDLNTCSLCHPSGYCSDCHGMGVPHAGDFGATHGILAKEDRASCLGCHTEQAFCDSCHGIAMPHPIGFLPEHSEISEGLEDPVCLTCHTTANCNECHERHAHPGRPQPFREPDWRLWWGQEF